MTADADLTEEVVEDRFNYYPSQMYICLYYDTTLVLKRSGVLFADDPGSS